jgi:hypothetical protein
MTGGCIQDERLLLPEEPLETLEPLEALEPLEPVEDLLANMRLDGELPGPCAPK